MQSLINYFGQYETLYKLYSTRLNNCLSAYRLDGNQYAIIQFLFHEGPNAMENIAQNQCVDPKILSKMIKELVKTGYIVCISEDKKKLIYSLTPLGESIYRESEPAIDIFLERALEGIPDEEQILAVRVFGKIKENLLKDEAN